MSLVAHSGTPEQVVVRVVLRDRLDQRRRALRQAESAGYVRSELKWLDHTSGQSRPA